jgi:hypothetical protein
MNHKYEQDTSLGSMPMGLPSASTSPTRVRQVMEGRSDPMKRWNGWEDEMINSSLSPAAAAFIADGYGWQPGSHNGCLERGPEHCTKKER